jgi:GNAT superfamily N-acetyltransferase
VIAEKEFQIRGPGPADATGIAEVHVATWQAAYAGIFPAEFLSAMSVEHRAEVWNRILAEAGDGAGLHVAVARGRIVGFAHGGPSRDTDAGDAAEVYAVYVRPEHWGTGVGRALHDALVAELTAGGASEATLWVLEPNRRARAFYEREGWKYDGRAETIERGDTAVQELRYRRTLP